MRRRSETRILRENKEKQESEEARDKSAVWYKYAVFKQVNQKKIIAYLFILDYLLYDFEQKPIER